MNLRLILGAVAGVLALGVLVLIFSGDARRAAELKAVEAIGEVAIARMAESSDGGDRAASFTEIPIEVRKLADNVYQARGIANTQLIATSEGNVLFDTGLSLQVPKQKRLLEAAAPDVPLTHIIVSHSHADHMGGVKFWVEDGTEVIAHQEYSEEQRYLTELQPYLHFRNRTLFPFLPEEVPSIGLIAYGGVEPTRVVRNGEPHVFELGGTRFEVLAAPGAEGADNIVLWLPDQKIFFSGDFFGPLYPQFPNIFTMRGEKIRKPIEYIRSLNEVIALAPEMIVPSHKDPIVGKEKIMEGLVRMRDAVQYVHDQTVAGMNAGKTVYELMEEIQLPPQLALNQAHGRVSWGVKSIWEYYATWFHFDRTTELYPVSPWDVYPEVVELAGIDALVARANAHIEAGRPVHALHLLEIALGPDGSHAAALQARRAALEILLEEAEVGLKNAYEIDWLKFRLRATDEKLGAGGDA